MPNHPDFVVIGAGVIGMMTARSLADEGATVKIIDRRIAGHGASWAGGGILSPLYPWLLDDAVSHLAKWSQEAYPDLSQNLFETTGIDSEYVRCGLLLDSDNSENSEKWASTWETQFKCVNTTELSTLEPHLDISTHLYSMPDIAQIRNPRLVKALRKSLEHPRIELTEETDVESLIVEQDEVSGIKTASDKVYAGNTIVTTGAWTADWMKNYTPPPIYPAKGQMIIIKTPPNLLNHITLFKGRYVIPRQDGNVLVGSTLENCGFDTTTDAEALQTLTTYAYQIIPELKKYPVTHQWAGLRPGNDRTIPYIGEHPYFRNLYLNTGHFRNGLVLAPASARLLTNLIMGQDPIVDSAPYSLDS